MPLAGPDHDVRRVPPADEVVEGEEEGAGQGDPAEPARQAERAHPLRSELAHEEVAVHRRRHGDDVADVGEDVDAHRRAEEAHHEGADHVEDHRPVRHVVLVLVLEERGRSRSSEAWNSDRATPMMALSTDSSRAKISGMPMTYLTQPASPKMWSAEAGVERERVGRLERRPEHADEDDGGGDVDEHAVEALGGQGDLGVAGRVAALADVAGGRLHGDGVPRDHEDPGQEEDGPRASSGSA